MISIKNTLMCKISTAYDGILAKKLFSPIRSW